MIKEIREELDQLGEESYRQFNQKLIPRDRLCDWCSSPGASETGQRNRKDRIGEQYLKEASDRNK